MRRAALACLSLALSVCKPHASAPERPGAGSATAPAADPRLVELAAKIDPGPQPSLLDRLPDWLKRRVQPLTDAAPGSAEATAAAREAIAAWGKRPSQDPEATLLAALQLGRGVVLAEQALAAGASDPELLAALVVAYGGLVQVAALERNAMFAQAFALAGELGREQGSDEAAQVDALRAFLEQVRTQAPALQRHVAARLFREYPTHPTVPSALSHLAAERERAEDYAGGEPLRALAVELLGTRASAEDHFNLAVTRYRALDLASGDAALRAAEARGPEPGEDKAAAHKQRLSGVQALRGRAARVLELGEAKGLEEGLERAHLLRQMGRAREAEAKFAALRAAHPGDARPVTGLTLVVLQQTYDAAKGAALIREGRALANRDRLYYEVALGTVTTAELAKIMVSVARDEAKDLEPRLLAAFAEVEPLVAGYRAFDPARADTIALVLASARKISLGYLQRGAAAAIALARELPPQVLALVKQHPDSPDARKLLYAVSRLLRPAEALALLSAPLPESLVRDQGVWVQQMRALLELWFYWDHAAAAPEVDRALARLPEGVPEAVALHFRATVDAVRGRRGDAAALQRALDGFRWLAERASDKDLAQHVNNLGVLLATAGDVGGAISAFGVAAAADPGRWSAWINLGALAHTTLGPDTEGLVERFRSAHASGETATLRLQSLAWLVALAAAGKGDLGLARREFSAAAAKERAAEYRPELSLSLSGVAVGGSFSFSLGYAWPDGLVLVAEVVSTYDLIYPAPGAEELARSLSAGKPKKQRPG